MDAKDEPLDAEIIEDNKDLTTTPGPTPATTPVVAPEGDYTTAGVPTFDYVRDRIETRVATNTGATELAEATPEAKTAEDQYEARKKAGQEKLEQIRRSMQNKNTP